MSTGFQSAQTGFSGLSSSRSSFSGETLVAGGLQPPSTPAAPTPAIPLSTIGGTIPRQPNSTPVGGAEPSGVIMPPAPNAPK